MAAAARKRVEISPDPSACAAGVCRWILDVLQTQPAVRIALAGGTTPLGTYRQLAAALRDRPALLHKVTWYWTDERFRPAPPQHSNRDWAARALFEHLPVESSAIHAISSEDVSAEHAARSYEQQLRGKYRSITRDHSASLFTIVLLGMGTDGHTAALFPGTGALNEATKWVVATRTPEGDDRISLTLPALSSADYVGFIVNGAAKRAALAHALCPGSEFPAALIRARKEVLWFVDQDAFGPGRPATLAPEP